MNDEVLGFLLNGLEDYLEAERDCGARTIEVDRSLLVVPPAAQPRVAPIPTPIPAPIPAPSRSTPATPAIPVAPAASAPLDFVFLHDKPLSQKATVMMSKIIVAMGKTLETAPIVIEPPIPKARFFIFLGPRAIAKYMPGLRGSENKWFKTPKGKEGLLVRSPEDIVRFPTVTPALDAIKKRMWLALKTVLQRVKMTEESDK